MREKTLFNSILFKVAFLVILISISFLNIYWNWGVLAESNQNALILLSVPNIYLGFAIKLVLLGVLLFFTPLVGRKFKLIERNKDISSFFLIVLFVLLSAQNINLNAIVSGVLILVFFNSFLKIYNQASIQTVLFYASLLVSFLTFLISGSAIVLIVFWIGVSIIRPFRIKEYLVSLIAFCIPLLYYYSGLFMWDMAITQPNLNPNISFDLPILEWLVLALILVASIHSISYRSKMIAHQRNQMTFMLLIVLVSLSLTFLYDKQYLIIAALPASFFLGNLYRSVKKKWIIDVIALSVLLLIPLLKFI